MQPYLFPYLGYFQLISAVDKFVIYDDVTFIKGGWINRNLLLISGTARFFTIPLDHASSHQLIKDVRIDLSFHERHGKKLLKTIEQNYSNAPLFPKVFPIVQEVLTDTSDFMCALAVKSIHAICEYLKIQTEIVESSVVYQNAELHGVERVLDVCKKERAHTYVNAIGGQELYDPMKFQEERIALKFVKTHPMQYKQFHETFVPNLSIIDVLMFNDVASMNVFLNSYELID